jgi:predicted enzyme related to lactoylglutathione lyase
MQEKLTMQAGHFCWVDISTTDLEAAKKFYTEIFGWTFQTHETSEMPYTTIFKDGKPVAGMASLKEEAKSMGVPPHWMCYVNTVDCAATVAKAREAGGNILMDKVAISDHGAMAIFQDPEGAVIAVWQAGPDIEEIHRNFPGAPCWDEKGSHDKAESIVFYEKVFGWTNETSNATGMEYTVFKKDGKEVGGCYIMPEIIKDLPSHWMTYFMTDDIEGLVEKAKELGGEVPMEIMQAEGVGKFCVVKDPQGAAFGVLG